MYSALNVIKKAIVLVVVQPVNWQNIAQKYTFLLNFIYNSISNLINNTNSLKGMSNKIMEEVS